MSRQRNLSWLAAGSALVIILVVAIIINNNHTNNAINTLINTINTDNGDLKINWDRYNINDIALSESLTITKPGIYHLTGTLSDGEVNINVTGEDNAVKLILDNVYINNSSGPVIACYSADDLIIELVGDNILIDGGTYASSYDTDVTGAIYSKADLTFQGDGTLNLTANYQDGIVSKDDLKFNSGTYHIIAKDDAIRGKDSVYIVNGGFTISATGDGIRSTNDIDAGKGFVLIENGNFTISAGDDGIHAINKLIINGGNIVVSKAYEGLEAQVIAINDGKINLTTTDDGINAGGGSDASIKNADPFNADENCILSINGGEIYVNAAGDGVDSNGWLYFNGGTTIIDGPTNNGNGALDSGLGIVTNGGKVIAIGASGMAETLGSASSIYNISVYFSNTLPTGTVIEIKNSDNQTILSHTSAKSFNHLAAGTPDFQFGDTYTIYIDDEKYTSFTISNIATIVGNGNPHQNMPPNRDNQR